MARSSWQQRRRAIGWQLAVGTTAVALSCAKVIEGGGTLPAPRPVGFADTGAVPDSFRVLFETSQGDFTVLAHRDWAPLGVERFRELVQQEFFDEQRFFRVRAGFIAQFGLHRDPATIASWKARTIPDDPPRHRNRRGTLAFAFTTANTRSTQIFINLADNARLDAEPFAVFAEIVDGIDVIDRLYAGYDESAGGGMRGGKQGRIEAEGNAHLARDFPRLDYIRRARLISSDHGHS